MTARPSLVRSIPFWILLVGSLASTAVGAWLVVDKISLMNTTLTDGSATGVEVYGGQAWVTLGAVLVGAGLVGLVATLFLGVLRSFVPAAAREEVGPTAEELAYEPALATHAASPAYPAPAYPAPTAPAAAASAAAGPAAQAPAADVSPADASADAAPADAPADAAPADAAPADAPADAPASPAAPAAPAAAGYTPAPAEPADEPTRSA
ncbi:hypothetical protein [Microbacterium sp. BK668]|uniref:hypothetical protein n=1 Tax=Microbacterium sp. BK668 TaxID=2512118 RepID=UPI0010E23A25|nr:hypothetical protein [Microbacterium sp. BK668]TDN93096.1 hypothetical protein EV279_2639 [Microbacterium sp. BK668]